MSAFIDVSSHGATGCSLISALVDAGADKQKILTLPMAIKNCMPEVTSFSAIFQQASARGISGTSLLVRLERRDVAEASLRDEQVTLQNCIEEGVRQAMGSARAAQAAQRFMSELIDATGIVAGKEGLANSLGIPLAQIAFELAGAALALDSLGLLGSRMCISPVPVGGEEDGKGNENLRPAAVTLKVLSRHGMKTLPQRKASVTPTASSILALLADPTCDDRIMIPRKVGYGISPSKEQVGIVKVIVGDDRPLELKPVELLETDVDDVTGEVAAKAIEDLMAAGALDAYAIPEFRKKGRPGLLVRVVCHREDSAKLASILMGVTGSLGVRFMPTERVEASRKTVVVEFSGLSFKVKLAWNQEGKLVSAKPEFEDIRTGSDKLGLPPSVLSGLVMAKAISTTEQGKSQFTF
ncbi:MAG: nickel insertion protein [Thermoprotei archaeon]|nr:DUF111 family protein [TACK group archaeon]